MLSLPTRLWLGRRLLRAHLAMRLLSRVAALAAGFRGEVTVLREAALVTSDALATLDAGGTGEFRILHEAALVPRHALAALAADLEQTLPRECGEAVLLVGHCVSFQVDSRAT